MTRHNVIWKTYLSNSIQCTVTYITTFPLICYMATRKSSKICTSTYASQYFLSNWPLLNFINLRHTKLRISILLFYQDDRNQSFSSVVFYGSPMWQSLHIKLKSEVNNSKNTLWLIPRSFCDFCKNFKWD